MSPKHIVRSYDADLDRAKSKIMEMGRSCVAQLDHATKALETNDSVLAKRTMKGDELINTLYSEIDGFTVRLLAIRQPLAGDLRHIISGLKIATDLERIADYSANIAEHVIGLDNVILEQPVKAMVEMADKARSMLSDAMEAYRNVDIFKATDVWHRDDEIDRDYSQLLSQLRQYLTDDQNNINAFTHMLFVARSCERIGDHITNIAESIYYIETGQFYHGNDAAGE